MSSFIKKRDGRVVPFESLKIESAIKKAFIAKNIYDEKVVGTLLQKIITEVDNKFGEENTPTVERIQDIVEECLIENNFPMVAKAYIIYRQERAKIREEKIILAIKKGELRFAKSDGKVGLLDPAKIKEELVKIKGELSRVNIDEIISEIIKTVYDGILEDEISQLILNAVKVKIEEDPEYSLFSSRLLLNDLYKSILKTEIYTPDLLQKYQQKIVEYIDYGVAHGLLNPKLKEFDLEKIAQAIVPYRDKLFYYLGTQTICDRYLLRRRINPQEDICRKLFESQG